MNNNTLINKIIEINSKSANALDSIISIIEDIKINNDDSHRINVIETMNKFLYGSNKLPSHSNWEFIISKVPKLKVRDPLMYDHIYDKLEKIYPGARDKGVWMDASESPYSNTEHFSFMYEDKIYVFFESTSGRVVIYNTLDNTWESYSYRDYPNLRLPVDLYAYDPEYNNSVISIEGKGAYVISPCIRTGESAPSFKPSGQIFHFDVENMVWNILDTTMPIPLFNSTVSYIDGEIHCFHGKDTSKSGTATSVWVEFEHQSYNIDNNEWTVHDKIPIIEQKLEYSIIGGGVIKGTTELVLVGERLSLHYNFKTKEFAHSEGINTPYPAYDCIRDAIVYSESDNTLSIMGGRVYSVEKPEHYCYDMINRKWYRGADLTVLRSDLTLISKGNKIYSIFGTRSSGDPHINILIKPFGGVGND